MFSGFHMKNSSPYPPKSPHQRARPPQGAATKAPREQRTSWKQVSDWYDSIVGEHGHFYHQHVILPNVLKLLNLQPNNRVLDIGCGQGVMSRRLPSSVDYVGIDVAKPLLEAAKKYPSSSHRTFIHADLTHPWPLAKEALFSHAVCILVLQNIEEPEIVFSELAKALETNGRAVFVLNHPYFRIPRQSRWGYDEPTKQQTRELFGYMSHKKIPIITNPQRGGEQTWSFHVPLSDYTAMMEKAGLVIERIEEWCSPKESDGGAERQENRARKEFPLFMAIVLRKSSPTTASKSQSRSQ